MIMKRVNQISVDSGLIMICDREYYRNKEPRLDKRLSRVIEIPVGKYSTYWRIPKTWNGGISGNGVLNVTSGKVVISDPCYVISNQGDYWMNWLNETDYGSKPPEGTLILDKMGGDGTYTVYLSLELM
jgi:hypothetical protein